jgi:hypothetical protein
MSLDWYVKGEPQIIELEERCVACGMPMAQKGTSIFCTSGAPACPIRVAMSKRTTGDVFNEAARRAGRVAEARYNDMWSQLNATR